MHSISKNITLTFLHLEIERAESYFFVVGVFFVAAIRPVSVSHSLHDTRCGSTRSNWMASWVFAVYHSFLLLFHHAPMLQNATWISFYRRLAAREGHRLMCQNLRVVGYL
jgi:hypothetical protein